jgi:peptide/nickel transport system substrate-binding protein
VKKALFLILSFLLAFPVIAQEKSTPKYGGTIRFSAHRDIGSLNPFFNTRSWVRRIMTLSYEPLLTFNDKYEIEPNLAASWTVSPDGLVYTFELRRGVKFHNGQELTAADVKWSFDFARDPRNIATGMAVLSEIDRIDAAGSHSVRVRLKTRSAIFLDSLTLIQNLPIVAKDSLVTGKIKPEKAPPGTGPFEISSWQPDRQIVFKKHSQYWKKGLPYVDEVVYRRITEEATRFAALRTGELDVANLTNQADVLNIKAGKIQGIKLAESVHSNFRRLIFNVRDGLFKDKRLRQAVAFAIDKKQMIQGAYFGLGFPTNQMVPPGSPYFFKDVPDRSGDLAQATKLLKEAGHEKGFRFVATGRRGTEQEFQVIQSMLRKAGIEMVLQMLDPAVYDARERKGEFSLILSGGDVNPEPNNAYFEDYYTEPGEARARNSSGFSNPEMDRLLIEGKTTINEEKRKQIYRRVVEILNEEVPSISLAFIVRFYGVRPNVQGLRADQTNGNLYHPGGGGWGLPVAWVE